MEDKPERNLEQVASADRRLQKLIEAGRLFDRLDRLVQPTLPEPARGHIRVACIEGRCLVLAAGSPAWASRARLLADSVLETVNRQLPEPLEQTRVIVVESMAR
ncbi:DUF721 domain-containing protein [Wenzhouxiangella sp. AB-CW3]|uniref:DciA family protein n=1 Tax=Wenzhouxiangella sp. AB-CW3 TaxID=2771012 RepID=UPI00168ABA26|nr:DciA family protein [Wenzhouxiangella sp. AB-CW3]QOC23204.1 DUF721 domain-containing protein [Wenzhouxiangella sp. AB-CW3]